MMIDGIPNRPKPFFTKRTLLDETITRAIRTGMEKMDLRGELQILVKYRMTGKWDKVCSHGIQSARTGIQPNKSFANGQKLHYYPTTLPLVGDRQRILSQQKSRSDITWSMALGQQLGSTNSSLLKIAMEIVDLPIKDGDVPQLW